MDNFHNSVLLKETLEHLQVKPGELYIDATLGGGGHTLRILKRGGSVLSLDVDEEAIKYVEGELKIKNEKLKIGKDKLTLARGNFRKIDKIAKENGFENVAGIIFDLGVSSHQFDTKERGFSFMNYADLDMRMNRELQVTAADLLNALSKEELYRLFTEYGEERYANKIATGIITARKVKPIEKTSELTEIIKRNSPNVKQKINPATRVFQALRIAVNDEIGALEEALPKARDLLKIEGRLVVISFHSLEDRVVKRKFNEWEEAGYGNNLLKKPITPTQEEITINSRSRSAKMRVFEKK